MTDFRVLKIKREVHPPHCWKYSIIENGTNAIAETDSKEIIITG